MLRFFSLIRLQRADAHLLILTGSPETLPSALERFPVLKLAVSTMSVSADLVPEYLACADLGMALRRTSFSMQGVAPIKLGEYLLCGLPVVASTGVGNTDAIGPDVGFLVSEMDDSGLDAAANWFLNTALPQRETFRLRCNETGIAHFSLDACVDNHHKALLAL